ncbi:hypothetical protein FJY69_04245 [candidate division WOR-3 bacterium]|nr:hypothetical protein [candidate division WOR-3 bacterium]
MKKTLVVVLIVVAALVAAYFLAAGIIDMRIKTVSGRLERAGYAVAAQDLPRLFAEGSKEAAAVLREAAEHFPKDERGRIAGFDTLGWKTDPAGLRALRAEKAEGLRLMLKASTMGPANFEMDYEDGMDAQLCGILPQFGDGRTCLSVEARALAAEGRADSALGMVDASIRLSHALAEPVLVYTLVELLGLDTAFAQAARLSAVASPPAVERVAATIRGIDPNAELIRALQGDGAWVRSAFRAGQTFLGTESRETPALWFLPLRRYAELKQLEAEEQQLAFAGKPWHEGLPLLEAHERSFAFADSGPLRRLARFGVVDLRPFYGRIERNSALRDLALAAIAVSSDRRRTGRLPERLDPGLPVDRFTGKTYGYKVTPGGFAVYSAGKDGEDNGGDPEKDLVIEVGI